MKKGFLKSLLFVVFCGFYAFGATAAVSLFSDYGQIQNVQNYSSNPFWTPNSPYNQRLPQPVYVQGADLNAEDCFKVVQSLVSVQCMARDNCKDTALADIRPTIMVQLSNLPGNNYVSACSGFIDGVFESYVAQFGNNVPNRAVAFPNATTPNPSINNDNTIKIQNPYKQEKPQWQQDIIERSIELQQLQQETGAGSEHLSATGFPETYADLSFTDRINLATADYAQYKDKSAYVIPNFQNIKEWCAGKGAGSAECEAEEKQQGTTAQTKTSGTGTATGAAGGATRVYYKWDEEAAKKFLADIHNCISLYGGRALTEKEKDTLGKVLGIAATVEEELLLGEIWDTRDASDKVVRERALSDKSKLESLFKQTPLYETCNNDGGHVMGGINGLRYVQLVTVGSQRSPLEELVATGELTTKEGQTAVGIHEKVINNLRKNGFSEEEISKMDARARANPDGLPMVNTINWALELQEAATSGALQTQTIEGTTLLKNDKEKFYSARACYYPQGIVSGGCANERVSTGKNWLGNLCLAICNTDPITDDLNTKVLYPIMKKKYCVDKSSKEFKIVEHESRQSITMTEQQYKEIKTKIKSDLADKGACDNGYLNLDIQFGTIKSGTFTLIESVTVDE